MYKGQFESKAGGSRKMGSIGGCRLVEDIAATGVSLQFAHTIARALLAPPYPPELQQQPDPRYGLETRRRLHERLWCERAERWGRRLCAAMVLGCILALWVWSVYRVFL